MNLKQFQQKPKLGGNETASFIQQQLESAIEGTFLSINQTNEEKRQHFVVSSFMRENKCVLMNLTQ